ncbi:MAG: hypothetical protein L3J93_05355 [Thermoplasmata archaeon]|nr:hypothetical protein [Thermoplasmata archaeon]
MRHLSRAASRVIQVLLADVRGTEEDRIRIARVPRSTFESIRRKAFRNGWLRERYLPNPSALGLSRVRFELGRPYADRWIEAAKGWQARPGTVVLWCFPETLLSVRFEPPDPDADGSTRARRGDASDASPFRTLWSVDVNLERTPVPVYFDFEGAWTRWTGREANITYPLGIPIAHPMRSANGDGPVAPDARRTVAALLANAASRTTGALGPLLLSPLHFPLEQQRLLRDGVVFRRVLPDFPRIPARLGGPVEQVVFVTGFLRPSGHPEGLLARLAGEASAAPFLLAYDADRLLLGMLAPRPPGLPERKGKVLAILRDALTEIEIEREPVGRMSLLVDHRYEDLVPAPAEAIGGPVSSAGVV